MDQRRLDEALVPHGFGLPQAVQPLFVPTHAIPKAHARKAPYERTRSDQLRALLQILELEFQPLPVHQVVRIEAGNPRRRAAGKAIVERSHQAPRGAPQQMDAPVPDRPPLRPGHG